MDTKTMEYGLNRYKCTIQKLLSSLVVQGQALEKPHNQTYAVGRC